MRIVRVIAHVVVPVITPVIARNDARDDVRVIAPVIAREQACVQDRNAQSATDTPQVAPCAAYGTTQASVALYRAQREGGG